MSSSLSSTKWSSGITRHTPWNPSFSAFSSVSIHTNLYWMCVRISSKDSQIFSPLATTTFFPKDCYFSYSTEEDAGMIQGEDISQRDTTKKSCLSSTPRQDFEPNRCSLTAYFIYFSLSEVTQVVYSGWGAGTVKTAIWISTPHLWALTTPSLCIEHHTKTADLYYENGWDKILCKQCTGSHRRLWEQRKVFTEKTKLMD